MTDPFEERMAQPFDIGIAPYRTLQVFHRMTLEGLRYQTPDMVVDAMKTRIEAEAHSMRTLLSAKPHEPEVEFRLRWGGWEFPEEDREVYRSERVARALGATVARPGQDLHYLRPPRP